MTSIDKEFIQNAMEIIKEHFADSKFNTTKFASSLAISRSQLHKKFVALAGEPPGEFIRRVRLNKAAELIKCNSGNITEIAFDVGFNNLSYFTASFRKQFGVSPSLYQNSNTVI